MNIAPGAQLGPYNLLSLLGAGGMGEVYSARDTRLDRDVAIKVLSVSLSGDEQARRRFEREAKAVAALSHPNILAVHDFSAQEDVWYLVTELLVGETLRDRLQLGAIPWRRALEIAVLIAEGLAAAHEKGVIHRDLKPENVFLTSDGQVKILDFGLALRQEVLRAETATEAYLTAPGMIVGTTFYMSPEQLRGESVDPSTDIFSFGCLLYEMIGGLRPFSGAHLPEVIAAILYGEPPDLAPELPADLRSLIRHCLQKDRTQRFGSARDLAIVLRSTGSHSYPQISAQPDSTRDSIGIVPLRVSQMDEDLEYLSDGVTESVVNALTQIRSLRVVPNSTMSRYKGRDADMRTIAAQMSIRTILTGRISRIGSTIILAVELIDAARDTRMWGERYQRDGNDLLNLPETLAAAIVDRLRAELTTDEQRALSKRTTESREAYEAYLRGRFHFNRRNEAAVNTAIGFFHSAIEKDPTYAHAYSGLADAYLLLGSYGVAPRDCVPKAKAAATEALRIDEEIAEAHASLGFATSFYEWRWREGERHFARAIEINPSYGLARHWFGVQLTARKRFEEGQRELNSAHQLDPLSLIFNTGVGAGYRWNRQYARAVDEYRKVLELDPQFLPALLQLADAYIHLSLPDEAAVVAEKALRLEPENTAAMAARARVHHLSGARDHALRLQRAMTELATRRYVSSVDLASIETALGNHDHSISLLECALEEGAWSLAFIGVDAQWDVLRSNPRFVRLLRETGLC
ncbi:MAG TPA: protein kinase [Thermoanaerobaculia bacterium]|nr:protein kinase [Thermoanaerobaculia bacterium]